MALQPVYRRSLSSLLSIVRSLGCRHSSFLENTPLVLQSSHHAHHTLIDPQLHLPTTSLHSPNNNFNSSSHHRHYSSTSSLPPHCWRCNTSLTDSSDLFFCHQCKAVQPSNPSIDPFTLLGYPTPTFSINTTDLEARYKSLQRLLHPDKFSTASLQEKEHSSNHSASVNKAYASLKHPISRAVSLLKTKPLANPLVIEEGHTIQDPELLAFVMEAREEVDDTHDVDVLKGMKKECEERASKVEEKLGQAIANEEYEDAVELVTRLRYLARIQEAIVHKL